MTVISPRTPAGTMELLPGQQIAFQRLLDTIRRGYERFGYLPIETPAFELTDVLLTKSGGETEKQVYFVQSTGALRQGEQPDMALRFDLTVPLARYVAEHERDLAFPFRRYQIQRVYRGERAQKGRYREFYQCDIDIIGKNTLPILHDAELPAVINQVFSDLGVGEFIIKINNRKVLRGLLTTLGVVDEEAQQAVLRELDKLDKAGEDKVRAALADVPGGPDAAALERLFGLIRRSADGNDAVLDQLACLDRPDPLLSEGIGELRAVVEGVCRFGVPESRLGIDLAIARGLDYYTGTVYETFLVAQRGLGSVCSGGRYENLASHYTRSRLPGVGLSIGASRLFSQLLDAGMIRTGGATSAVLVTWLDDALGAEYMALAAELRAAGINCELQLEGGKLAKQLKYADRLGIPYAVVLGADEQARGTVMVKTLATGTQEEWPRAELADRLRERGV